MYSVGEIIATNRKKLGLSQPELAELLGKEGHELTYKAISKWEKNYSEPSVTIFFSLCKILGITNMYEAYFGTNPDDPLSTLNENGKKKALDYIDLLHDSGKYEKPVCKIIPFIRKIDIYQNAVSAGTGNFITDGPKATIEVNDEDIIPDAATFGVLISGDSMMPYYEHGQIAWVHQQETLENGDIGIFLLNGESYIKKLKTSKDGTYLISLNDKYPPREVKPEHSFYVFGKVVGNSNAADIPGYAN